MILSGGLILLVQAFLDVPAMTKLFVVIPSITLLFILCAYATRDYDLEDAPSTMSGWSILTASPFFHSRFNFLNSAVERMKQPIFKFKLFQHTVIVVTGTRGRKEFLTLRSLDLNEGFALLSGAIPMLPGVTSDLQARRIATIHKRLGATQSSAHLSRLLPKILYDAERITRLWGESGTIDIFDCIPKLFFQTTVRSLSTDELADDEAAVTRLRELYDDLDASTAPASVLFPWFPSRSMIRKLIATKKIYNVINSAIKKRVQDGVAQGDTLQILIDNADDRLIMVGFIMGLLVAGSRSTGTTASWLITFLAGHPEWREKAKAEANSLLMHHSTHLPSGSIGASLATVPLEAWENEMPVLDSIIRETLRLAQPHTAMRRNVGPDAHIYGTRVPSGSYVVYPFSDVHLDPELYPDPWKFDPERPVPKGPYSWIGWGSGTTTCLGQRLARLSLKAVTTLLLLEFDFELVDINTGRLPNPLPAPNWNDALTCKPSGDGHYLRYHLTKSAHLF